MLGGEVRKVSAWEMQRVQNLIVRCLELYMNQREVVDTLSFQAKIEPSFTEHVWQKLEEENCEFFKAYHAKLILKNQILVFNKLLEKQVELMQKACLSGVATVPSINGSNLSADQTPSSTSPNASTLSRPDTMLYNGDLLSALPNSRPSGQQGNCLDSGPLLLNKSMTASTRVLSAHNFDGGRIAGTNGTVLVQSVPNYMSNSEFLFSNGSIILEAHQPYQDASTGSFSSTDFVGQPSHCSLLDVDASSPEFSQIPRDISFSDLADDFTHCANILEENYDMPHLPSGSNSSGLI